MLPGRKRAWHNSRALVRLSRQIDPSFYRANLMADELEKNPGTSRFRLPKFFTQGAEAAAEATLAEIDVSRQPDAIAPASAPTATGPSNGVAVAPGDVAGQIVVMQEILNGLSSQIAQVNERETSLERVFDALHSELADYKNDFLYEHLKPVVRPLLFLFDSLEQFDGEVAMAQESMTGESQGEILSPPVVRENIRYFRDQLIEALRTCEVTIMDAPRGGFNAKFQKAVDIMPVAQDQDNQILRVVRSGWFLNGQLLRPAEVVVGKFRG